MRTKVLKPFLFFIMIVTVVSLACMGSSETPSPEPPAPQPPVEQPPVQEQPTDEQLAPPTEVPQEPAAPAAQEYFTEQFDGDTGNWSYFVIDGSKSVPTFVDDKLGDSDLGADGGYLVFDLVEEYQWTYVFYDAFEYKDVRLDVVADNRGTNNNNVSLICRYTEDEGWYEFNIANNGLYWIYHALVKPDGTVVYSLLADGGSNKIKQGKDVNTYTVICEGRTLSLYINSNETRQLDDNKFVLRDGKVGVSISSFRDLPVKVEVDSFTISQP